jgi:hypothetical protein
MSPFMLEYCIEKFLKTHSILTSNKIERVSTYTFKDSLIGEFNICPFVWSVAYGMEFHIHYFKQKNEDPKKTSKAFLSSLLPHAINNSYESYVNNCPKSKKIQKNMHTSYNLNILICYP